MSYEYGEAIDPANPGDWVLVEDNEHFRRWELDLGDKVIRKTEAKGTETLLDEASAIRSLKAGQRWGDGQIVGRIPLNLYYSSGMAEASRQRDIKYQRKFYREHPKLKTFDGDL